MAIAEGEGPDPGGADHAPGGSSPPWAQAVGKGFQPINARSETVATKAPFAELFARPERRCLVLADGWYEWLKAERRVGRACPIPLYGDEGGPFAFAACRGRRRIGGDLIHSALILTTAANAVAAPVHDRMPCVLAGPDEEAAWLAGESEGLMAPLDARAHRSHPRQTRRQHCRGGRGGTAHPAAAERAAQLTLDT